MRYSVAAMLVLLVSAPTHSAAQGACPSTRLLPAYSHNDYDNSRPLAEALELGFRGVEADVILRRGELRVGHEATTSRRGRTLERLYLQPLRAITAQCGRVVAAATPFLVNVELKERSQAAYDSLIALIRRYPDLFQPESTRSGPLVQLVLVGWYPEPVDSMFEPEPGVWLQERITSSSSHVELRKLSAVRLVSLDYGKTIGWSGQGPPPQKAASWLARVRAVKLGRPERLARAYNAPVNSAVYRLLLDGGIDLIGAERLASARQVLVDLDLPPDGVPRSHDSSR